MNPEPGQTLRQKVAERAYHVCEYCLLHEDDSFWGFEVEHVISRKHSGATALDNLAWACATCNRNKGTDLATLQGNPPRLTRLFHPRQDAWLVEIEGVSDVGAATARLLKLNEDIRLKERRSLEHAGRYPTVEALARMKE
jgi:hypothetical protein